MPTQVGLLSNLQGYFGIMGSGLSGTLPTEVGGLTALRGEGFTVVANRLSGTIPDELGKLTQLGQGPVGRATMGLARNRFTGGVPSSVADIERVHHMSICYNQLSWVPLSSWQCPYEVGYCDALYRSPYERTTDGTTAWYYDENAQCTRCPDYPKLSRGLR